MKRRLTLIIVPLSTLNQWQDEISRFTGGTLRVYCWHGDGVVHKDDFNADAYDIVVTTYDTCANDILLKAKRVKKKKGKGKGKQMKNGNTYTLNTYTYTYTRTHIAEKCELE